MQSSESSSKATTEKTMEQLEKMTISHSTSSSSSLSQATVKIRAALDFIHAVKERFMEDEPEVHDEFLALMKAYRCQHIDMAGVIQRINHLFSDHPDLITGFDNFLPQDSSTSGFAIGAAESRGEGDGDSNSSGTASPGDGSRSATPTPEDIPKVTEPQGIPGEPTIAYIQRVKQQCDTETWEQFMSILSRQIDDPVAFDEEEMIRDVEELFEDHHELIPGFRTLWANKQGKLRKPNSVEDREHRKVHGKVIGIIERD